MQTIPSDITVDHIRKILSEVCDPEIPVISIEELGILRSITSDGQKVIVTITPTYSGCPAMDTIAIDVFAKMKAAGIENFDVRTQISPAWTTDWISEDGKRKLREFGISPPSGKAGSEIVEHQHPVCPYCLSENTELVSQFGSTACKALFRCISCGEPFDYFKCH